MTRFHVGTAGWSYLKWEKDFYPKGLPKDEHLAFYASQFDAVELNNSFYHLPPPEQFLKWEAQTPARFRFAVKAPRAITHLKRLKDPETSLPRFLDTVAVQEKPGPVLLQLPPTFRLDLPRLEIFVSHLPKDRRFAIELRDPSWHADPVYDLLARHRVAFCLYDTPEGVSPIVKTADFSYTRLRGRKQRTLRAFLRGWRDRIGESSETAYVFFDNRDDKSLAFGNALVFRDLTTETR